MFLVMHLHVSSSYVIVTAANDFVISSDALEFKANVLAVAAKLKASEV